MTRKKRRIPLTWKKSDPGIAKMLGQVLRVGQAESKGVAMATSSEVRNAAIFSTLSNIYICIFMYMYIWLYIYISLCVCIYDCIPRRCAYIYIYISLCICIYDCIYIYYLMYMYIWLYMYMYLYICICICICICIYVYIYVYTYKQSWSIPSVNSLRRRGSMKRKGSWEVGCWPQCIRCAVWRFQL